MAFCTLAALLKCLSELHPHIVCVDNSHASRNNTVSKTLLKRVFMSSKLTWEELAKI